MIETFIGSFELSALQKKALPSLRTSIIKGATLRGNDLYVVADRALTPAEVALLGNAFSMIDKLKLSSDALRNHSYANKSDFEIDQYIDQISDLNSAKVILKRVLKDIVFIMKFIGAK